MAMPGADRYDFIDFRNGLYINNDKSYSGGEVMIENNNQNHQDEKVAAKCTKCKTMVDHEVVSQSDEGIILKMRCLLCGNEHKFRSTKGRTPSRVVRPKKVDPAKDFNLLAETFKEKRHQRYSMSGVFKAGDVIDHNTFGIGIVINAMNKQMEVVFSDHPRILVFNREEMEISR